MIQIENLSFNYYRKKEPIIRGLNLTFEPGLVYGLLGPNGAGKSTLLYLISGLLTPTSGSIKMDGVITRRRLPSILSEIFIVPEEFELPPITLSNYVKLNAPYYPHFSNDDMKRHLATFGMDDDPNLGKLSMGQKKKVFMAFALACNTKVLLMDEPTNGLDIPGKSAFRRFIASNMNDDRIVIISTHQVRDIDNLLDHIVMLNENKLICSSSINDITSHLAFLSLRDNQAVDGILFSQATLEGNQVILENDGSMDTRLDLELLFQFALEDGVKLNNILSKNE